MSRAGCCLVVLLLAGTALAGTTHCFVPWYSSQAPCLDTEITIEPGQTVTLDVRAIKKEDGQAAPETCATLWLKNSKTRNPLATLYICVGAPKSWKNENDVTMKALLDANVKVKADRIVEGVYTVK